MSYAIGKTRYMCVCFCCNQNGVSMPLVCVTWMLTQYGFLVTMLAHALVKMWIVKSNLKHKK
jgi:hypothetical protein